MGDPEWDAHKHECGDDQWYAGAVAEHRDGLRGQGACGVSQLRGVAREHRVQRVRSIVGRVGVDGAPGDDAVGAHEHAAVGEMP